MLMVCHPGCGTCKKARKWLDERGIDYELRDIRQENPTEVELAEWKERSGLPLKRFFNTSGQQYRALGLQDRLPEMDEAEQIRVLASDGMLVRRPILVWEGQVLVGFREEEWRAALEK